MLSVIIPVYNAEQFIRKCLESILAQTLKDIEVIVVDDKGDDLSISIVKELQNSHPRGSIIKIFEMPHNSGAAAARNYGLHQATGEYIAFVDSDDWCEPSMYDTLYSKAKDNDSDWCYANAVKEYPDGRKSEIRQIDVLSGELSIETRKAMLTNFAAYFTTSIYKRCFLQQNHIEFPLFRFSEDSFFVWNVIMHAKRFAAIDDVFYHYIIQPNSVSNTYDGTKHLQKIEVFSLLINQLKEESLYFPYKEELDYLFIKKGFFIPLIICAINNDNNTYQHIKPIFDSVEKMVPDYKKNIYYKKNYPLRILVFLAQFFPNIFRIIMKRYSQNRREMF